MRRLFSKTDRFFFFQYHVVCTWHNTLDHVHLLGSPHAENLGIQHLLSVPKLRLPLLPRVSSHCKFKCSMACVEEVEHM